jgi:hypothetical protein
MPRAPHASGRAAAGTAADDTSAPIAASAWGGVVGRADPTGPPCSVCGESCSTSSSKRLSPCGHLACASCVSQLRRAAILTAERGVRCPAPGCQQTVQGYLEEAPGRATSAGVAAASAGRGGGRGAQPAKEAAERRDGNSGRDGAGREGRVRPPVAKGSVLRGGRLVIDGWPAGRPAIVTKATPRPATAKAITAAKPLDAEKMADAEKNSEPW